MSTGLIARGARGGGIVIIGQFARIFIQLLGVVILSRLLSPADFGLIAMVAIFIALGDLLRDFGMPTAALQAPTLSHQQASNIFWVNAALSGAVAVILAATAPLIVRLYDQPELQTIVPALAIAILLNGVQAQVQVQLARSMHYRALAVTDVCSQALGLLAAVAAAIGGWGYWSLVLQTLVTALSLLLMRSAAARWLPALPRRGHNSRSLLLTGSDFGFAQLLTFFANNSDTLIIGTRWGATSLGYYNRAFQIYSLPRSGLLDPLAGVVIPTVTKIVASSGLAAGFQLLLRAQYVLSVPLVLAYSSMAVTAEWLIPAVLGPQWQPSVPVFQALSIAGCFASFGNICYWMFVLSGNSRHLLYLHLLTKPLTVILILLAAPFGIVAVAFAFSASAAIAWPVNLLWLKRVTKIPMSRYFVDGLRVIFAGAASFVVARAILGAIPGADGLPAIGAGVALTAVFFLIGLNAAPGGPRLFRDAIRNIAMIIDARRS